MAGVRPSLYGPPSGARLLGDFPDPWVALACRRCLRRGRYRLATLLGRFGPQMPLPEVLGRLAAPCGQGLDRYANPCGAYYEALAASEVEPGP